MKHRTTPYILEKDGIYYSLCDEWMDYICFAKWAFRNGYSDNLTIDRIDVNGNYEASNCRWIPMKEQHSNKRNNHFVIVDGEKMTLTQCSENS